MIYKLFFVNRFINFSSRKNYKKKFYGENLYIFLTIGKRPFGVSILYMGWDRRHGYQLYQSDPSGNYSGWKATCIGNSSGVSIILFTLHTLFSFI